MPKKKALTPVQVHAKYAAVAGMIMRDASFAAQVKSDPHTVLEGVLRAQNAVAPDLFPWLTVDKDEDNDDVVAKVYSWPVSQLQTKAAAFLTEPPTSPV